MNTDLMKKIALNDARHKELSNRVFNAIENHKNFRILGIDIDNTLIDDKPIREQMLREILGEEYDVIMQRADEMYRSGNPDDMALSSSLIGDMYDRVFEEAEERFVGKMRYDEIYRIERFFPGTIDFIRNLIASRKENDFVVFVSHHNVDREAHSKIDLMYEVFPEMDGIYLPKYHNEPYGYHGARKVVSKVGFLGESIYQDFQLPIIKNLHINLTSNIFMVDDSTTVLLDSLSKGANIVPFLPTEIPQASDDQYERFIRKGSLYCDLSRVYGDITTLDTLNKNKVLIK